MDTATFVGTLFILVFMAILVVSRLGQDANRRVARVPVLIERIKTGTRSRKNEGSEHIL